VPIHSERPHAKFDFADIRFDFTPLACGDFSPFFQPFQSLGAAAGESCLVDICGASDELCGMQSPHAWSFAQYQGAACLTGANRSGQVMWRMTGEAPYARLRFDWHPFAFDEMYHNEVYGRFGIVAILALVLRLLHLDGLVMHGSAQLVEGQAIICTGPSGRGKSTISRLFDSRGIPVLTDERPLVRRFVREGGERFRVYGSPWPSAGGFVLNTAAPLRKIYFLEHGPEQVVEPISTREAVFRMLDVSMVPWLDTAFFDPVIQTMEALINAVPHAVLRFRPDVSVVDAIRRDLDFEMEPYGKNQ
jgi:hypothetical protein